MTVPPQQAEQAHGTNPTESSPKPAYQCEFCSRGAVTFGLHGRGICDVCVRLLVGAWNKRAAARSGVRGADPATLFRGGGPTCAEVGMCKPTYPRGAA